MKRAIFSVFGLLALLLAGALGWTYAEHGLYGLHVVMLRGGSVWPRVGADDPRLTEAVRLSLHGAHPTGGDFAWRTSAPGFDTAELPLLVEGRAVDAILLARFDPRRWSLSVHNRPSGDRNVDDWTETLGAALVVNGSYYDHRGLADIPIRSAGVALGPAAYEARHGAFVAGADSAEIVDLATRDWRDVFGSAPEAFVSYPLLLDEQGRTRAPPSDWLANRSFIAEDRQGRILIGTTRDASLRLSDLARVLGAAPLDLKLALNLDGGPVACQRIELPDFKRRVCGAMEVQANGDDIRLLQPVFGHWDWALPMALAVKPKS